ncbi:hypothetical protein AVEN_170262-1 [Araneus ventricosus]|uniref:Uncharacterized protein n=1 Tax=Araneus ventricosus TaxID=182803 RepID=A0A4Y2H9I8_ARAVE|nr:hypothetical protein AVEN_170262-1 [Araneus ventricosus]
MHGKGYQENPHFCFGGRVLSNVTLRNPRRCPEEPAVNEIVSLAKARGLEVNQWARGRADHRRSLWSCIVFHSKKLWKRVCKRRR